MRDAFIVALTEAAETDARITFLTADLGFKLFDAFARRFPGRFFNAGIAEANMAGVSAGMALEGKKPFIYSIVPFVTSRCFEQIRNDICYHDLDVTLVGVGGGYSYGQNGPTHHSLEDLAIMRVLPNMTIIAPGDPLETAAAVRAIAARRGPCYLRLGRAGERLVHASVPDLRIGESLTLREGRDVTLLSTGNMLATAIDVADLLGASGIETRVVSMPTVKPLDTATLDRAARETGAVVTLEEHGIAGGFGSAVAEYLAEQGDSTLFRRFGVADRFADACGDQGYLRGRAGLDPESIAEGVRLLFRPAGRRQGGTT